jgi:biopolymer transport protein ExbD
MADTVKQLDLWIVETNTIYRDVPFTVVTDWIQQGRLLPDDKVRQAGGADWQLLGAAPAFAVYFPKPEPQRAEDPAEALEPVEPEFAWKTSMSGEDEDVDMIPLIDVSLVLLVFFMMTAVVTTGILSPIDTPPAKFELLTIGDDMFWVGINGRSPTGKVEKGADGWPTPWYTVGKGHDSFPLPDGDARQLEPVLKKLEEALADAKGTVRVRLRADLAISSAVVRQVTAELQKLEVKLNAKRTTPQSKISISISGEVSEAPG